MEAALELKKIADAYNQRIENEKFKEYFEGELLDTLLAAASRGEYFVKIKTPDNISFPAVEYALKLNGYNITMADSMSRSLRVEWRGKD